MGLCKMEIQNLFLMKNLCNFHFPNHRMKVRKIQSKIQNYFVNRNKLGGSTNENVLNPKNGPAYCQVVSAILFCEKRPHCITISRRKEGARAK